MSYRTPRARALGLGVAHGGTRHWWAQRLTAVALVPLAILFVVPFARALGAGHEAAVALYRDPFHAIIAVLFLATAFRHLKLGLQVVIEDYVHGKAWRTGLLVANSLLTTFFAVAGIFSVLRIAFTG